MRGRLHHLTRNLSAVCRFASLWERTLPACWFRHSAETNFYLDFGSLPSGGMEKVRESLEAFASTLQACAPQTTAATFRRRIPRNCLRILPRDLFGSLPMRSAAGLPVHVAVSLAAPFLTSLGITVRPRFFHRCGQRTNPLPVWPLARVPPAPQTSALRRG